MTPFSTIAAWLIIGTASPDDASQSVRAIPFASHAYCERRMDVVLQAQPARMTIKPYCTNLRPSFWIEMKQ